MPYELVEDALTLLEVALDESFYYRDTFIGPSGFDDWEEIYSYRHARNVFQLGTEALHLRESGHWHSINLILRAQLESLFCLGATLIDHQFARSKAIAEINHFIKFTSKHLDPSLKLQLQEMSEKIREASPVPVVEKRYTVRETAEKADLEFLYTWYQLFSGQIHGDIAGLVNSETGGAEGLQLNLMSSSPSIATGLFIQIVPSSNPQGFLDEAASLLDRNVKFSEEGIFSVLDVAEEEWKTEFFRK